jgi:nucleotide-binding universal stress UspA family protein
MMMTATTTVLAALDGSAAARAVLETAAAVADVFGGRVEGVHVDDGSGVEVPQALAARHGVPLRVVAVVPGDDAIERTLAREVTAPDVTVVVVGARALPGAGRRVGHLARAVATASRAPVVVVPPEAARGAGDGPGASVRRALVPLESAAPAPDAVLDCVARLRQRGVDVVAVHVFVDDGPRVADHPVRDLALLGDEFLARSIPGAIADIDLRAGPVGTEVLRAAAEAGAELIVLSWSQDLSPGRAAVVRDVVRYATVPVLLLPVSNSTKTTSSWPTTQASWPGGITAASPATNSAVVPSGRSTMSRPVTG